MIYNQKFDLYLHTSLERVYFKKKKCEISE